MKTIITTLALLLLLLAPLAAHAADPVAGRVRWAGPVRAGQQIVNFGRADVAGWTQLSVTIRPGNPAYRPGEAIWVHRAQGRILGISHQ